MSYLGFKHSAETIQKIRLAQSGRKPSFETRVKMSVAKKGKPSFFRGKRHSIESRIKLSLSHTGKFGILSSNWKGGTSRAYKTGYYSSEYKAWRKRVFERDGYTCQKCGFHGSKGYITAHHIKSFAHHPELRFEITNGVTLCEPCHKKTDNYKGRANRKYG